MKYVLMLFLVMFLSGCGQREIPFQDYHNLSETPKKLVVVDMDKINICNAGINDSISWLVPIPEDPAYYELPMDLIIDSPQSDIPHKIPKGTKIYFRKEISNAPSTP